MANPSILLIWELIPESIALFLIPEQFFLNKKELFLEANNKYVNTLSYKDNNGSNYLNAATSESQYFEQDVWPVEEDWGVLLQYKIEDIDSLSDVNIVKVLKAGFYL